MGSFENAGRPHFPVIRIMTERAVLDLPMARSLFVEVIGKILVE
jgi:hypothetical protein